MLHKDVGVWETLGQYDLLFVPQRLIRNGAGLHLCTCWSETDRHQYENG